VQDPRSGLTGEAALEASSSRSTPDGGCQGLPAKTRGGNGRSPRTIGGPREAPHGHLKTQAR
jgi:hypothetical protein